MKRTALAAVVFIALLGAYWASPFLTLSGMAADIKARDAAALIEHVDFPRLRRSLAQQIIAAYLRLTGRAARLGSFGNVLVAGVGLTLADPILEKVITPENLDRLFANESVPTEVGDLSLRFGSLSSWLESGWHAWLNPEYGFGRFSVALPADAAAPDQFRCRAPWKIAPSASRGIAPSLD